MQSGQIVFLNEINHTPNLHASSANHAFLVRKGDYVRVSGAVTFLDATNRYCEIEDGSHKLIVDLSVVDIRAHLVSGDICQFIGELRDFREKELFWTCEHFTSNGPNRLYLHARVNCAVRDLDFKLFKEAIILRRAFVSRMMETT